MMWPVGFAGSAAIAAVSVPCLEPKRVYVLGREREREIERERERSVRERERTTNDENRFFYRLTRTNDSFEKKRGHHALRLCARPAAGKVNRWLTVLKRWIWKIAPVEFWYPGVPCWQDLR